jgi:hypothetical protein
MFPVFSMPGLFALPGLALHDTCVQTNKLMKLKLMGQPFYAHVEEANPHLLT